MNSIKPLAHDYLKSLAKPAAATISEGHGIRYYPGSGKDSGPFHLFADTGFCRTIIYSDYRVEEYDARAFVTSLEGWTAGVVERLRPIDYGVHFWEEFWPDDEKSRVDSNPASAFAVKVTLSRARANDVTFIFFGTEAIQTFSIVSRAGLQPTSLVLQDHGFGCNWCNFGGAESPLYEYAIALGLPQYLLVADNTDPWPNYQQVSKFTVQAGLGSGNSHDRACFRRLAHSST